MNQPTVHSGCRCYCCIVATIRTHQQIQCLPYQGFLFDITCKSYFENFYRNISLVMTIGLLWVILDNNIEQLQSSRESTIRLVCQGSLSQKFEYLNATNNPHIKISHRDVELISEIVLEAMPVFSLRLSVGPASVWPYCTERIS